MDAWEDFDACYRTLDLTPDASPEEVKTAWRDLVKIWHPDRFASEPRLQQRCQEKIKQINLAYEMLKQRVGEPDAPVLYRPEPALRCVLCGRIMGAGQRICVWCDDPATAAAPIRDTITWRWTLTGIGVIVIAAVLFHFAFDGMQHTFTYLFVLLAGLAFLRQFFHSLR